MKQTKEDDLQEHIEAQEQFDSKLAGLKEKYKDFLTEDVIRHYCLKHRLDREEAILKLCANYENEANSVDAKAVAMNSMNSMKAVRMLSPKVMGIEQREKDVQYRVRQLEMEVRGLHKLIEKQEQEKADFLKRWTNAFEKIEQDFAEKMNELDQVHQKLEEGLALISEKPKGLFGWISSKLNNSHQNSSKR